MSRVRNLLVGLVLAANLTGPATADEKQAGLTPLQFRVASMRLLEDPLHQDAPEMARAILIFVIQTPDAAVVLGDAELKWIKKEDKRGLLLFAAYMAGNAQSQLHSGIKRNDRYSGLLYLFQVYRRLQAKDKEFRIAEVEDLLKLHREDKLTAHLSEIEKKQPSKLTPEQEEEVRKLLQGKKE
jgi:hypothetical protein